MTELSIDTKKRRVRVRLELLGEAEQYRLLRKPNEQPKPINLMSNLMGLFTLKLYTIRHSTG